jgi:hypothetical protein
VQHNSHPFTAARRYLRDGRDHRQKYGGMAAFVRHVPVGAAPAAVLRPTTPMPLVHLPSFRAMHLKLKSTDLHQFRPHLSTASRTNNYHNLPIGLFPVMPDLSTRFHLEQKPLFPGM